MNSSGTPDTMPSYKVYPLFGLFFVAFIIIGHLLIMNLFVGVITSSYERARAQIGDNFLLTED